MTLAEPILTQAQALATRCAEDFPFFAATCLKIRTKPGDVIPLRLNRAQRYVHERLEDQKRRTGIVRAVVVKGRQLGISTYIQARFYWLLWRSRKALMAFILTHEDPATENLFGMAKRFQELMPPHLKPLEKTANAKQLLFAANDCGYQVATAGGREVGRSSTIQLCHGSEVAFWPNAESHINSLLTGAIAKALGTEVVLESTAQGIGNVFERYARAAMRGKSEYEAIFIPWFWGDDYRDSEGWPSNETPSEEWVEYAQQHELDWEQLRWAYLKNREKAQSKSLNPDKISADFMADFPATFEEAFQTSGESFIPGPAVLRARKPAEPIIGRGPVILGIDPARDRDPVGIVDRCGRRMGERICEAWEPQGDTVFLAQRIAAILDRLKPDAANIDIGSNGAGVYDELVAMGYGDILNAVNFGSAPVGRGPTGDRMYLNRRAEMHDLMRDWFETPGGVQVPDNDIFHKEVTAAVWGPSGTRYNTSNALVIEEKQKIVERIGYSPGLNDAAVLTFAVPLSSAMLVQSGPAPKRHVRRKRGGY